MTPDGTRQGVAPTSGATRRRPARVRLAVAAVGTGGVALVVAQATTNISNVAFHLVASNRLGPQDYGALGSVLVVVGALCVPVGLLETMVAAHVAVARGRGEPIDPRRAIRRAVGVGVLGAVFLLTAAPLLAAYLHLASVTPLVWLAVYCLPLSAGVVPWGVLCGQCRFAVVGVATLAGGVLRCVLAGGAFELGFGLSGAIAASVGSDSVRTLILLLALRRSEHGGAGPAAPLRLPVRGVLAGGAASTGLWLLLCGNIVLVRHLFPDARAGRYVAAATVAGAAVLVAQLACVLAVPYFAAEREERARAALRATVGFVLAVGGGLTVLLVSVGPRLLTVLFGQGFGSSGWFVGVLAVVATGMGVLWVVVQYHVARDRRTAAPWFGVAAALLGAGLWHSSPGALAAVLLGAVLLSVLVGLHQATGGRPLARRQARNRQAAQSPRVEPLAPVGPPLPSASAVRVDRVVRVDRADRADRADRVAQIDPLGRSELGEPAVGSLDLTVVVPFFNPGHLLRPNLLGLIDALQQSGATFEIITVEDGCTDQSPASIADLDRVRRFALPRNCGKGAALRLGLREGRGRYVGFIDADGDIDPRLWQPFLGLIRLYQPDIIIGSKCHPLSETDPEISWVRRAGSWGYRALVRLLFPTLPVADTQVGIKVFRRELLVRALPHTMERKFVFDLELLLVARRLGYRRVMAAPVTLRRRTSSTVRPGAVWRMFADTVAVAWRLYVRRSYGPAAADRPGEQPTSATPASTHAAVATLTEATCGPGAGVGEVRTEELSRAAPAGLCGRY